MSQTRLEMAKDLVTELIRAHHLPPDEAKTLLQSTHAMLLRLHQQEASRAAAMSETHGEVGRWTGKAVFISTP